MATRRRPGEFELIARYFRPLATGAGAFALSDDAAVFTPRAGEDLVMTCDALAEGVHFFADDPPVSIARKALRVNLSDLAAKGAVPAGYLLALALPADWTEAWIKAFAAGLAGDQRRYGVALLGGDTIRAAGRTTIAITALGRVPSGAMVRRAGARPGDVVFVSGTIGDAALGLRIRRGELDAGRGTKHLTGRFLHPEPRVAIVEALRRYASSAMDVSDGLVGDLAHICEVSGVGAEIDWARIPLSAAARRVVTADASARVTVLNGGDDYEILATVAESDADRFAAAADEAGIAITRIGRILAGKGPPIVKDAAGQPIRLTGHSHTHF